MAGNFLGHSQFGTCPMNHFQWLRFVSPDLFEMQ